MGTEEVPKGVSVSFDDDYDEDAVTEMMMIVMTMKTIQKRGAIGTEEGCLCLCPLPSHYFGQAKHRLGSPEATW